MGSWATDVQQAVTWATDQLAGGVLSAMVAHGIGERWQDLDVGECRAIVDAAGNLLGARQRSPGAIRPLGYDGIAVGV